MTHQEFITQVRENYRDENHNAREWLKNVTRFQMSKKGVGSNQTPVKLITTRTLSPHIGSPGPDLFNNCLENISQGINLILGCYPTFSNLLEKYAQNAPDWKNTLENILQDTEKKRMKCIEHKVFKSEIASILNPDLLSILPTNRNEEIGNLIMKLSKALNDLKIRYEDEKKIDEIVYLTNGPDYRNVLSTIYKIGEKDLPNVDGADDMGYLGVYRHFGEILIYLDVIYDNAVALGLDPYLLYRKVFIHELAHAFHHRGIDAKDRIWDKFKYSEETRVYIVEGLAQWHAMQYMIYLDNLDMKRNETRGMNLVTIIWFSLFQRPEYRHYLKWAIYSNENIRRTIVEARAMTGTLRTVDAFDKELELNHSKSV
jgi:hypothetical protein